MNEDSDATSSVLAEVADERARQIAKGYTREHDDEHNLSRIIGYGGLNWYPPHWSKQDHRSTRKTMVRMVACLVAGIEWLDRRGERPDVL